MRRHQARRASPSTKAVVAVAAGLTLGGVARQHTAAARAYVPSAAAVAAVAYATAQVGKPYVWGGTGPDGFDCSGLVMRAWGHAGVTIPRTSEEQWAALRHVTTPRPGDLVFFPGADGTWAAPGHVALVVSASRIVQAYGDGVPVEVSPLSGDGAGGIVGYARP